MNDENDWVKYEKQDALKEQMSIQFEKKSIRKKKMRKRKIYLTVSEICQVDRLNKWTLHVSC